MEAEQRFRVELHLKDVSRRVLVSAPSELPAAAVSRVLKGFSKDTKVESKLMGLDDDCAVEMITTMPESGLPEIVGVSVPDCNEG